jgi:hypothetical protein
VGAVAVAGPEVEEEVDVVEEERVSEWSEEDAGAGVEEVRVVCV